MPLSSRMDLHHLSQIVEKLWNGWELRILMLLSLFLQTILAIFGDRRKYATGFWLRFVVWLSYMSADWVATFSLGILARSQTSNSANPNLIPVFWAPILLLHLGGPETITAYSLADNELWTRRLLELGIQAGVASYVLYKLWSRNTIIFVAIPIFVSGIIKYGERIRAFMIATSVNFSAAYQSSAPRRSCLPFEELYHINDRSHEVRSFHEACALYRTVQILSKNLPLAHLDQRFTYDLVSEKKAEEAFGLTEIELGFMTRKRWSSSMGQHNLISAQTKKPMSKLLKHFMRKWKIPSPVNVNRDLKALIFQQVMDKRSRYERLRYDPDTSDFLILLELLEERGYNALKSKFCHKLGWSVTDVEFSHSLLTWHIATHVCYIDDSRKNGFANHQNCAMSRSLSNYMLYLLVHCPAMLAIELSGTRYADTRIHLGRLLFIRNTYNKEAETNISTYKFDTLSFPKAQVKAFFYELLRSPSTMLNEIREQDQGENSALLDGCMLAMSLQSSETQDGWPNEKKWEMISEGWVEMLMYAASHCGWKEHADALARGGELLTHVCLLMAHLGLSKQCPPEVSKQLDDRSKRLDDFLKTVVFGNEV
ncbi:hypothetical protein NC652_015569 [Populus alba x Populus x berolinensis]|nr:hypothetical protein NC652_015569 [Populus alba x Populus x berolinensis]